jgi:molybdopterin molybdotransferase
LARLISVQEAQRGILSQFSPVPTTIVPLEQSNGRVLSQDIYSEIGFPPFANSSMDGFAVRSVDISNADSANPVSLAVVADIPAGIHPTITLQTGEAARIMTGAEIPSGADAVIPVENTNAEAAQPGLPASPEILIYRSVDPGAYIRQAGEDIQSGQKLLYSGRKLTPQDIGLLATLGIISVPVYRRPRIASFSTGNELIDPSAPLTPGKIRNSNSYSLAALIEQNGGEVLRLPVAKDDPNVIRQRFDQAVSKQADLILTSAGVSVGAHDYVRAVVEEHGRLDFWRVDVRPGKPLAFGSYRSIPVIGLPGNPVSAYIGFLLFVLPALYKMSGLPEPIRRTLKVYLEHPIESDGRESYLRARVRLQDGKYLAALTGHQGSGNLYSLVQSNALLVVPSGVKSLPVDAECESWLLDDALTLT